MIILRRATRLRQLGACALLLVAACGDLFGPDEDVLTLQVAPALVECQGMFIQECMQVRERPDEPWTFFYDQIEGFAFEPGFLYTLRVARREIRNPPADGSSLSYRLLAVVSKISSQ